MPDLDRYYRFAVERHREYGSPPELALSNVEVCDKKWPAVNIYATPEEITLELIDEVADQFQAWRFDRKTGEVLAPSASGNISMFQPDPEPPVDLESDEEGEAV